MNRYNEMFESDSDIEKEFQIGAGYLKNNNLEVLYADYVPGDYSGDSFVVLKNTETGELFEVNGGHCSCYGLEGQFDLEPTTLESIEMRQGYCGRDFKGIVEFIRNN